MNSTPFRRSHPASLEASTCIVLQRQLPLPGSWDALEASRVIFKDATSKRPLSFWAVQVEVLTGPACPKLRVQILVCAGYACAWCLFRLQHCH